jgi:hypothetical protein
MTDNKYGRNSNSGPNLQNIVTHTELGRQIKGAFFPKGNLVEIDYSEYERDEDQCPAAEGTHGPRNSRCCCEDSRDE